MRDGGKILAEIFSELENMICPEQDVWELELKFLDLCKKNKVIPACKGYDRGNGNKFPTGLCVSINTDCVHCFPKRNQKLLCVKGVECFRCH